MLLSNNAHNALDGSPCDPFHGSGQRHHEHHQPHDHRRSIDSQRSTRTDNDLHDENRNNDHNKDDIRYRSTGKDQADLHHKSDRINPLSTLFHGGGTVSVNHAFNHDGSHASGEGASRSVSPSALNRSSTQEGRRGRRQQGESEGDLERDGGKGESPLSRASNEDAASSSPSAATAATGATAAATSAAVTMRNRTPRQGLQHMLNDPAALENNYRVLPLMIGCIIPVSILINVPSITSPWVGTAAYDETTQDWDLVNEVAIPHWLNVMIILALIMAIICNICVLFRFLERHIWHSVILSLITATLQDILCISAVVPFCILYPPSKGYIYLEGFWTMIASMVFSLTATVMMSIDLHRTPYFRLQGSGVTHKQRLLIAEAMSLCFYLAIGALIFIYIEHWTFLDALFFVMVTITTIGFGDRVPITSAGRAFVIFYAAGGIVLLALVVNSIRYVILEDLHRRFAMRAKERKARREARRMERREQRLREEVNRLRLQQTLERIREMEAAAGVGNQLNSQSSEDTQNHSRYFTHLPRHFNMSNGNHLRLPAIFTRNSEHSENKSVDGADEQSIRRSDSTLGDDLKADSIEMLPTGAEHKHARTSATEERDSQIHFQREDTGITFQDHPLPLRDIGRRFNAEDDLLRYATLEPRSLDDANDMPWWRRLLPFKSQPTVTPPRILTIEEQREADKRQAYRETMKEYQARLRLSFIMFMTFWLVGAIIFTFVESWDFGSSMYFVVIAFTTIGYGDFVPRTMAGRSIFLAYCLLGVVTLTSLASLISEVLSKRMRKHVVETQLRRVERLEALDGGQDEGHDEEHDEGHGDNFDLEEGDVQQDLASEDGTRNDRVQVLDGLVGADHEESAAIPAEDDTCQGSLQRLISVSKKFDELLQKVLGLDYFESDSNNVTQSGFEPSKPPTFTPGAIVDYLEKEEDASDRYLSPSITRDITSTSSIQRSSVRPFMHGRRHSTDPRSGGTFHGTTSTSANDGSQLKITAWPTSANHTPVIHPLDVGRKHAPSPAPSLPVAMLSSALPAHRHNKDGTITIAAVHWKHLIEYSKQFKALTQACEESLEKIAAWEVSERKLRLKRCQTRLRQKRLLEDRRRLLETREATHGGDDDGEEELEELEDWDEERSDDDEADEALDRRRIGIAASLLGIRNKSVRRSQSRGRRSRRSSAPQEGEGEGEDSTYLRPPPISLASQLQARLNSQGRKGSRRRSRSASRPRAHGSRPHSIDDREHRERPGRRRGSPSPRVHLAANRTDPNMTLDQSRPSIALIPSSPPSTVHGLSSLHPLQQERGSQSIHGISDTAFVSSPPSSP